MRNGMIEDSDGTKYWYKDGQLHRDDGPAVERSDGTNFWYKEDKQHRDDGPAIEYTDGTKEWYKDDKLLDAFYPDLGCAKGEIKSRQEALARLNRNPRPYSYDLYMADINEMFPEEVNKVPKHNSLSVAFGEYGSVEVDYALRTVEIINDDGRMTVMLDDLHSLIAALAYVEDVHYKHNQGA